MVDVIPGVLNGLPDCRLVCALFDRDLPGLRATTARSTAGIASTALVTVWAQWPQVMPSTLNSSILAFRLTDEPSFDLPMMEGLALFKGWSCFRCRHSCRWDSDKKVQH